MSTTPDLSAVEWIKSSYSQGNGGDCIEWAPAFAVSGVVPVRDSKDPHGPALTFESSAWSAFVSAAKAGKFGTI
ncbi:DUF397 domain-containing protein [Streptomyces natalensis]|uniref:Toxin-antitoxin system toxin subunit n=1 Tax=Streptomyces natalensis ATCC 27448 TaxID=1240678 RepID=A0A0D7CE13_9ACTN|nr:DUF397 domain-containing protein [Streptomyces natalensis]KIZ14493.1 toxin-antitoxin system toxin subunit [Streptomyces natalensis ATCC 27448]